jgi:hypothetical protein
MNLTGCDMILNAQDGSTCLEYSGVSGKVIS